MADGKYFTTNKKGEIHEFKVDLASVDRGKKKDAVKKVIAAMTVGKDVSSLFPDVVNCMQTDDMELKKLVYLYLINYAKTQPDLAIMAVNTFVKDTQDPNPLIRALAVRTMGCIRVDKITEYLCDPLQRCLRDDDPYVRKTAAVCVAKLYDINPELVEDRGFLDSLKDLIGDANPMVVANAVAALSEIQEISGKPVLQINASSLSKLLRALNECTEWGQVFILDSLAQYRPVDSKDAEGIIERILPRLQHANSAVVLAAIKVILKNMSAVGDGPLLAGLPKKLAAPLVTLLGAEAEIQYVALRNINLIVQKYPGILANDVKVFFCKYNDPIFVKMEKLDIMIKLANDRNIDQVLLELKEYATEVDVDFVRKAVRAIGSCAVSIEHAAERCINVLLELIQTKVNYVVQEAIIVIKDIFRRYPNRYESIITSLCDNLESLDEPEAKASMIWIIGEYAERIDNAEDLLEQFLETFPEETAAVQLQLVTATVKLFLKRPTEKPQQLIQLVLTFATQEADNPDLRDRAYIYWRLLSSDPEAAKDVVLAEKPIISDAKDALQGSLLDELLAELGSLASIYHKVPASFVTRSRLAVQRADELVLPEELRETLHEGQGGLPTTGGGSVATQHGSHGPVPDLLGDLVDLESKQVEEGSVAQASVATNQDLLGGLAAYSPDQGQALQLSSTATDPAEVVRSSAPRLSRILAPEQGKGLAVLGLLSRRAGAPAYWLELENTTTAALDGFMIQMNKNTFGLEPVSQAIAVHQIAPGERAALAVPLQQRAAMVSDGSATAALQIAFRCRQLGVFYASDTVPLSAVLLEEGIISSQEFVQSWKALPEGSEQQQTLPAAIRDIDVAKSQLEVNRLFVMAHKSLPGEEVLYVTGRVGLPVAPAQLLIELRFALATPGIRAFAKSERADLAGLAFGAVSAALAGS